LLARRIEQAVASADRDREPARESKNPLRRGIEHAEDGRLAGRRIDAEMRIDDGAKLVRHAQALHQRCRGIRRHGEDHGIAVGKRNDLVAEIERFDTLRPKPHGAELVLKLNRCAAPAKIIQRRVD
jgi:hypothetical protein